MKIIDAVIGSLQATGAAPPRQLWPAGAPPAADDLVARLRGKPWDVDYGQNPGLVLPKRWRTGASTARTCVT